MDQEPSANQQLGEPDSDSDVSSVSLISRALHSTTIRVTTLEGEVHFLSDKVDNLQHQRQGLEAAQAAASDRIAELRRSNEELQDRLTTAEENSRLLESQVDTLQARAEHQSIAIARLSRRLEAVERLLELRRIN